jgi:hypothetical protein
MLPAPAQVLETTNAELLPPSLILSECSGIYTTSPVPSATGPGNHPEGWAPPHPVSEIRIISAECQRIHYGELERGPISIVVEFHSQMEPPAACKPESGAMQFWMISQLWLTDSESVSAVVENDSLPSEVAPISILTTSDPLLHRAATWSSHDAESKLEVVQESESENYGSSWTAPARFYWQNHYGGISWMTFAVEGDYTNNFDHPVTGTLRPPFLQSNDPAYAGIGGMLERTTLGGEIHRFGNNDCTQPLD